MQSVSSAFLPPPSLFSPNRRDQKRASFLKKKRSNMLLKTDNKGEGGQNNNTACLRPSSSLARTFACRRNLSCVLLSLSCCSNKLCVCLTHLLRFPHLLGPQHTHTHERRVCSANHTTSQHQLLLPRMPTAVARCVLRATKQKGRKTKFVHWTPPCVCVRGVNTSRGPLVAPSRFEMHPPLCYSFLFEGAALSLLKRLPRVRAHRHTDKRPRPFSLALKTDNLGLACLCRATNYSHTSLATRWRGFVDHP